MGPAFKKRSIPAAVRRAAARAAGAKPNRDHQATTTWVSCHYCETPGTVTWWPGRDGAEGGWLSSTLEFDHVVPEYLGGEATADNVVLACRSCNRRKGWRGFK